MKKKIIGIMLVCSVFISACASGQDKEAAVQTDNQVQSEEKPETQTEQEAATEPFIPQLTLSDIDPYEKNLFEMFGLDNNFPKPVDTFEQVWVYSATGDEEIASNTGDMVQLPAASSLELAVKPEFNEDHLEEIIEYLIVEYSKQTRGMAWNQVDTFYFTALLDNGDYIEGDVRSPIKLTRYSPSDTFEIEAAVEEVYTTESSLHYDRETNIVLKDFGQYPWHVEFETSDGESIKIKVLNWAECFSYGGITYENATWERMPKKGDKINIKGYVYDRKHLRFTTKDLESYLGADSAVISEFEFLDD